MTSDQRLVYTNAEWNANLEAENDAVCINCKHRKGIHYIDSFTCMVNGCTCDGLLVFSSEHGLCTICGLKFESHTETTHKFRAYEKVSDMGVVAQGSDMVDHPAHYNAHPSGVECITVVEHMMFNIGSAIKYLWRADEKGSALEDLKKARWYIDREISKREKEMLQ